jgi:hypothetical protein
MRACVVNNAICEYGVYEYVFERGMRTIQGLHSGNANRLSKVSYMMRDKGTTKCDIDTATMI